MALGGIASLVLCVAYVAVSEFVFKPQVIDVRMGAPSLHAEDADVDELLRVISNAEDTLAAKHTVESTVLITDMKSFSAMTELDGSVLTAKAIQRHRDLLLPIVARNGGSGKSTGGDGLLAAFQRPGDAVTAAIEMQNTLDRYNSEHPAEHPTSIRVGMAHGEVVVDKHGRPFIGDALNKSARIMDLADGGQIFAEGEVMRLTPAPPPTHDHGPHQVKNIHDPLKVIEILWRDGQSPKAPRTAPSTTPPAQPLPAERDSDDGEGSPLDE
jgi:class 3 adenylate cyclase